MNLRHHARRFPVYIALTALLLAGQALCQDAGFSKTNPPRLAVKEHNGRPALFLNDKPIPAMLGDMSRAGSCIVIDGALRIDDSIQEGIRAESLVPVELPIKLSTLVTHKKSYNDTGEGSKLSVGLESLDDQISRYYILLSVRGGTNRLVIEKWDSKGKQVLMDEVSDWQFGKTVEMSLALHGDMLDAYLDGKLVKSVRDPQGVPKHKYLALVGGYRTAGRFEQFTATDAAGKVVIEDDFEDAKESRKKWGGFLPQVPFMEAGIHVYTADVGDLWHNWKGPGKFDWSDVGRFLDSMVEEDPDALLIPRFFLRIPDWWVKSYPSDVMLTLDGNEKSPRRLTIDSVNWPSYSSQTWRQQACEAIADFVKYLRNHPQGWRVVGLNVCAGHAKEWVYGFVGGYCDYSPVQIAGFRKWLTKRYGNDQNLKRAWSDDKASLQAATIPTPDELTKVRYFDLYDPKTSQRIIDYNEYHCAVVSDTLLQFTKAVKDYTQGRMFTMAFFGYMMSDGGNFRTSTGAQADYLRVLNSPHLDAVGSPHSYTHRYAGGSTITFIPWTSVQLHGKMIFDENDTRTHLAKAWMGYGRTDTPAQTAEVLRRDVAACATRSMGLWWWNWGRNWFADPPTMGVIKNLRDMMSESLASPEASSSEIALVLSPESKKYVRAGTELLRNLYRHQVQTSLYRVGAPIDMLLLDDIAKAKPYKMYIFLDSFYINSQDRAMIKNRLVETGATALWIYASGYITDKGFSLEAMSQLTGMKMAVMNVSGPLALRLTDATHPYTIGVSTAMPYEVRGEVGPLFYVDDPEARILGQVGAHELRGGHPDGGWGYKSRPGLAAKDMNGWKSVYSTLPVLPPALLRNIARQAGAHIYSDGDDFVSAGNSILSVHGAYAGERIIRLPGRCTVTDAISGQTIATDVTEFSVQLDAGQTGLWRVSQAK